VTKPTATPFGSVPAGSPVSKSSTRGRVAAIAGVTTPSALMSTLKTSRNENTVRLLFIVFSFGNYSLGYPKYIVKLRQPIIVERQKGGMEKSVIYMDVS
jgi:hypothetical protein